MGCFSSKDPMNGLEYKLLLLGIGGVGKSTVFKQLKMLHTSGFSPEERNSARLAIAVQMVQVILECVNLGIKKGNINITSEIEKSHAFLESLPNPFFLNDKALVDNLTKHLSRLWGNDDIKRVFHSVKEESIREKKNEALLDWADYFLDKAAKMLDNSLPIQDDDIIRLRRETSGAQRMTFIYKKQKMVMIDVGGQTHERSTWEPEFKEALAVIYMVSLSDYDVVTQGKGGLNRMLASLKLYQDLTENTALQTTPFIVLLNKSDVFAKKITEIGLDIAFPDIPEAMKNDYNWCLDYLTSKFTSIPRTSTSETQVYVTNATDSKLIDSVFDRITHAVISKSLQGVGMG